MKRNLRKEWMLDVDFMLIVSCDDDWHTEILFAV
jgi:hypothetical protein